MAADGTGCAARVLGRPALDLHRHACGASRHRLTRCEEGVVAAASRHRRPAPRRHRCALGMPPECTRVTGPARRGWRGRRQGIPSPSQMLAAVRRASRCVAAPPYSAWSACRGAAPSPKTPSPWRAACHGRARAPRARARAPETPPSRPRAPAPPPTTPPTIPTSRPSAAPACRRRRRRAAAASAAPAPWRAGRPCPRPRWGTSCPWCTPASAVQGSASSPRCSP